MAGRITQEEINFLMVAVPKYGKSYCCRELNRSMRAITRACEENGIKPIQSLSRTYDTVNLSIESWAKYYFIGVTYTDGTIVKHNKHKLNTWRHVSIDRDVVLWLSNFMQGNFNKGTDGNFSTHKTISEQDSYIMSMFGIINRKTYKIYDEQFLYNVPDEFLRDFIRGCIDGDGHISKDLKHVSLLGRKEFIQALVYRCQQLGFNFRKIYEFADSGNNLCSVGVSSNSHVDFLNWVYYDERNSPMFRKYQRARQTIDYRQRRGLK